MTKSKIGQPKVSSSPLKNPPALDMMESTYSDVEKNEKYHFEAHLNEEEEKSRSIQKGSLQL